MIDILKSSIKNWEEADTKWILSKDIGGFADEKEFLSVKEVKECAKNLKTCAISFMIRDIFAIRRLLILFVW